MKTKILIPLILTLAILAGLLPTNPAAAYQAPTSALNISTYSTKAPVKIVKFTKQVRRGSKAEVVIQNYAYVQNKGRFRGVGARCWGF